MFFVGIWFSTFRYYYYYYYYCMGMGNALILLFKMKIAFKVQTGNTLGFRCSVVFFLMGIELFFLMDRLRSSLGRGLAGARTTTVLIIPFPYWHIVPLSGKEYSYSPLITGKAEASTHLSPAFVACPSRQESDQARRQEGDELCSFTRIASSALSTNEPVHFHSGA